MKPRLTEEHVQAMGAALREFGYNVDNLTVRACAEAALRGDKQEDVIYLFVEGFLRDAGWPLPPIAQAEGGTA